MRLGAPVFGEFASAGEWVSALQQRGYSAAYFPLGADADADLIDAYVRAAKDANIVIAEVGAWSNPMSRDEKTRREAVEFCQRQLALADRVGARCCVNIAGSRGETWHGPDPTDLTAESFDAIVETVRSIIDAVKPTRTYYTLETMPWLYPDSADSYVRLIEAIDRERFGVHFDPVNLICSPQRFFNNAAVIRECFEKLGPRIRSCHGKDVTLSNKLLVHLDEVRPGLGSLDYRTFLGELSKLDPDTPLMLEHLRTDEEYTEAANYVRAVAREIGACFV